MPVQLMVIIQLGFCNHQDVRCAAMLWCAVPLLLLVCCCCCRPALLLLPLCPACCALLCHASLALCPGVACDALHAFLALYILLVGPWGACASALSLRFSFMVLSVQWGAGVCAAHNRVCHAVALTASLW